MVKEKSMAVVVVTLLILSFFTNGFFLLTKEVVADPGDVSEAWHNTSTLTITVYHAPATINWFDFRNATNVSKMNQQVDVNQQYNFAINVTAPNNWTEIEYINITAWYDDGSESSTYNSTHGGNRNLFLQYRNLTSGGTGGTGEYNMLWPDDEVTQGTWYEQVVNESCHNISLWFTPGYQFRYAPGDGSWSNANNATDDTRSWNFRIDVVTEGGNVTWVVGEFGVYHYCAIVSAGDPSAAALPAYNATADPITLVHRANANFSLSVNVSDLQEINGYDTIPNTSVGLKGGDKTGASNFDGSNPIYIYGGSSSYHAHDLNGTQHTTNDIIFHCNIPYGTLAGTYTANVYYHLRLDPS
ncbi:MAG TPA: hypothetical protein EYP23_04425 [Thermoplasmata archaeon]|nr:hypothetical protein [Thermoplasmata archaeon]